MRQTILQLLLLMTATWCAAQQGSIQKEGNVWTSVSNGTLTGVRNLHVKLDSGAVKVEGGSAQGLNYTIRNKSYEPSEERARQQLGAYKISAYTRGDTAWIIGEWQGGQPRKFYSEIKMSVPHDMELVKVETGGGDITTTTIVGRMEGQTGGGNIHLDGIGGEISIQTGGGNIDVGNAGANVKLRTGGGNIHIGSAKGAVVAETGGGNVSLASGAQGASLDTGAGTIKVEKCMGELKATTGGGTIELGEIGGEAKIETGGGTIKLVSSTGRVKADSGSGCIELWGVPSAHVETGAGTITAKFVPGGAADSVLETGTGDITVYLVPSVKMSLNASIEAASGHTISSDFSEIKVASEGGQWEKQVSAEGSLNGGGPMLKIRTTMGNIYIRRAQ